MVRAGREVRSQTDYILGTDHRLFWNVSVRYPGITRTTTWSLDASARLPEETLQVPQEAQADPPPAPAHPDEGRWILCVPKEGRLESQIHGSPVKFMDIGGHVEA